MSVSQPLPDVHAPEGDLQTFRARCAEGRRPAKTADATRAWPARAWTLDSLARRLGARAVEPVILRDGRFEVDLSEGVRVASMPLPEYLARIAAPGAPALYLRLPLTRDLADLGREAPIETFCARAVAQRRNLWIGAAGTSSDIHYDMTHNLVAQLVGRRRVTLFAPDQGPRLHPFPLRSLNWHHSPIRLDAPDLDAFPAFRDARRETVSLGPGEMLFIPRGWWHHFESLETSIAVNCFWVTPRHVPAIAAARVAWTLAAMRT